jgi:hypothetical protein
MIVVDYVSHRLNMELALQVYLGSLCTAVQLAETRKPPPPRIWAYIRGAQLVSQDTVDDISL